MKRIVCFVLFLCLFVSPVWAKSAAEREGEQVYAVALTMYYLGILNKLNEVHFGGSCAGRLQFMAGMPGSLAEQVCKKIDVSPTYNLYIDPADPVWKKVMDYAHEMRIKNKVNLSVTYKPPKPKKLTFKCEAGAYKELSCVTALLSFVSGHLSYLMQDPFFSCDAEISSQIFRVRNSVERLGDPPDLVKAFGQYKDLMIEACEWGYKGEGINIFNERRAKIMQVIRNWSDTISKYERAPW